MFWIWTWAGLHRSFRTSYLNMAMENNILQWQKHLQKGKFPMEPNLLTPCVEVPLRAYYGGTPMISMIMLREAGS